MPLAQLLSMVIRHFELAQNLIPLLLERGRAPGPRELVRSASLVLLGGLLLRMVVVLSSEQIHVIGTRVTGP